VLGAEQLRVVEEGKRMGGGGDPWAAPWTPKVPAQEARLFAPPQEARDSRLRIFSGTANRPLAQVGFSSFLLCFYHPEKKREIPFHPIFSSMVGSIPAWLDRDNSINS
jgi:hypothetical protein